MYGTTQQGAYIVPTSRKTPHPSQIPFDPTVSLTVKSMTRSNNSNDNWSKNYGRSCWTADLSRQHQHRDHNSTPQRSQPLVIHAQPGYRRSYTTMCDDTSGYTLSVPSTAGLPKRGQVKLTSLTTENTTPKSRAKTVAGTKRNKRTNQLGQIFHHEHRSHYGDNISDITMGDLQTVIEAEFPETQGLAFNRASQYIRTATANLMRAHSRPVSGASQITTRTSFTEPEPTNLQLTRPKSVKTLVMNKQNAVSDLGLEKDSENMAEPANDQRSEAGSRAAPVVNIPTS